jgi:hypothetical protein
MVFALANASAHAPSPVMFAVNPILY